MMSQDALLLVAAALPAVESLPVVGAVGAAVGTDVTARDGRRDLGRDEASLPGLDEQVAWATSDTLATPSLGAEVLLQEFPCVEVAGRCLVHERQGHLPRLGVVPHDAPARGAVEVVDPGFRDPELEATGLEDEAGLVESSLASRPDLSGREEGAVPSQDLGDSLSRHEDLCRDVHCRPITGKQQPIDLAPRPEGVELGQNGVVLRDQGQHVRPLHVDASCSCPELLCEGLDTEESENAPQGIQVEVGDSHQESVWGVLPIGQNTGNGVGAAGTVVGQGSPTAGDADVPVFSLDRCGGDARRLEGSKQVDEVGVAASGDDLDVLLVHGISSRKIEIPDANCPGYLTHFLKDKRSTLS